MSITSGEPQVLFQNTHLVVLDKPAGWLSVPARLGLAEPRPVLGLWVQKFLSKPVFPIHRLDEEVSGVILMALSREFHQVANDWFAKQQVIKNYQAMTARTAGTSIPFSGQRFRWESLVVRGKRRAFEAAHGKPAITEAECVGQVGPYWNWWVWPKTGRSHQIRLHLSKAGFPIAGDSLYQVSDSALGWAGPGIALRSVSLQLPNSSYGPEKFDTVLLAPE